MHDRLDDWEKVLVRLAFLVACSMLFVAWLASWHDIPVAGQRIWLAVPEIPVARNVHPQALAVGKGPEDPEQLDSQLVEPVGHIVGPVQVQDPEQQTASVVLVLVKLASCTKGWQTSLVCRLALVIRDAMTEAVVELVAIPIVLVARAGLLRPVDLRTAAKLRARQESVHSTDASAA